MKKFVVLVCVLMIAAMPTCFAYMNDSDVNLINYMDEHLISAAGLEESITEGRKDITGVMPYDIMCYDADLETGGGLTAIEYCDSEGNFHTWFAAFETREELYQFIEETIDAPHDFYFLKFNYLRLGHETMTYAAYYPTVEQDERRRWYSNVDDFISFLKTCE